MLKKEELEKIKALNALCELAPYIKINGVDFDYCDFGDKYDTEEENAEPYCCGNMKFIPKECDKKILEKYEITEEEYKQICVELDCLSFGSCGLCE